MGISLTKGGNISLVKEAPAITKFYVGLGWDEGANVDPDVTAFLCRLDGNGQPHLHQYSQENDGIVFFNNLVSPDGAVRHVYGDNQNGAQCVSRVGTPMEHDDEAISIDIAALDSGVAEVAIVVTIHDAAKRRQTFADVRNSFIRICENDGAGREIARFKLDESYSGFTAIHFGALIKEADGWHFDAVGDGFGSATQVVEFIDVVSQFK